MCGVAHFADEDDVGILAQCAAQGVGKRQRVVPDLALRHDTGLVFVYEFERVFHGDDMVVAGHVDLVDHGGERCGFAATRGTGEQDQTILQRAQFIQHRRQAEVVEREYLERNETHDDARVAIVAADVDAEAGLAVKEVGAVQLHHLLELLYVRVA